MKLTNPGLLYQKYSTMIILNKYDVHDSNRIMNLCYNISIQEFPTILSRFIYRYELGMLLENDVICSDLLTQLTKYIANSDNSKLVIFWFQYLAIKQQYSY